MKVVKEKSKNDENQRLYKLISMFGVEQDWLEGWLMNKFKLSKISIVNNNAGFAQVLVAELDHVIKEKIEGQMAKGTIRVQVNTMGDLAVYSMGPQGPQMVVAPGVGMKREHLLDILGIVTLNSSN